MYLKLFETVLVTQGITRTFICDTHTGNNHFVSNDFANLVKKFPTHSIDVLLQNCDAETMDVINEYVAFILDNGYGFSCGSAAEISLFPEKSLRFETPSIITNCIIDVANNSSYNLGDAFTQIIDMEIPFLQIRIAEDYSTEQILHLLQQLKAFDNSPINELFLLLLWQEDIDNYLKSNLVTEKYFTVLFYGANRNEKEVRVFNNVNINYTLTAINIPSCCGTIKVDNFIIQEDFYREGLQFNTCLNQKIAIDQKGEIKNCPSMAHSFGNISNTTLAAALAMSGFNDVWRITKKQISVCKHCEFRHVCTDCRAYLTNPYDVYSKPLKCGYNPYTNEWANWSDNPLSRMAMLHYGFDTDGINTEIATENSG